MTKVKKPFYKKWWVWVLAIIIVGGLATGGEESTEPKTDKPAEPAVAGTTDTKKKEEKKEKPAEPKVAGIGEAVKVGNVVFTVHGTETAKTIGNSALSQNAQGTYLIVDASVKNEGKESITTDSSFFKLKSGGAEYEADATADMYVNDANTMFFLQKVNPGNTTRGKIVFDVNDDVVNAKDTLLNVQTGFFGTEQGQIKISK